jgi:alpha-L-arabinofuranosidase
MADAVFSEGFLNSCLRHADAVRMACIAPIVNTRGPIQLSGESFATVLSGDSPDAWNGIEAPERVVPHAQPLAFSAGAVELAPHSVTVIELD